MISITYHFKRVYELKISKPIAKKSFLTVKLVSHVVDNSYNT